MAVTIVISAALSGQRSPKGPALAAILLVTAGDNPERLRSPASFAALCGTGPIPVSSGKTQRHRLSRGGDRQANWALHQIVKVRMSHDQRTRDYRDYRDKHLAAGWTLAAVYRSLKRAVAREVFRALTGHCEIPNYTDLRPTRQDKNLTLTTVAQHDRVATAFTLLLQRLACPHLRDRTRQTPRRHPGPELPRMAPSRLTGDRSIKHSKKGTGGIGWLGAALV